MLQLEAFDKYYDKVKLAEAHRLQELEARRQELERTVLQARQLAYKDAMNEATEDFDCKKQEEIRSLVQKNALQIHNLTSQLETSITEQAKHYASLMAGILTHFLPSLTKEKALGELVTSLSEILKSCDKRTVSLMMNEKTFTYLQEKLLVQSPRLIYMTDNTLEDGIVSIKYDGGGADIDFNQYQEQAIASVTKILGIEKEIGKGFIKNNYAT